MKEAGGKLRMREWRREEEGRGRRTRRRHGLRAVGVGRADGVAEAGRGTDEGGCYGGEEADAVVRRCEERKGIEGCAREEMGIDGRCGRIVGSSPWRRACVHATCEGIGCGAEEGRGGMQGRARLARVRRG